MLAVEEKGLCMPVCAKVLQAGHAQLAYDNGLCSLGGYHPLWMGACSSARATSCPELQAQQCAVFAMIGSALECDQSMPM